ncbi:MAG: hypothetical protein JWL61_2860 [Gemmatimonadetes bacterium]|nr:hypothetical protein [Gemmatimonadota bacterium]
MLHRRIHRVIVLAALLLQASCSAITGAESDFERARARWTSQRPAAYDYTLRLSCFCGGEVTRAVVIVVRGNLVESRTYADDGTGVPAQFTGAFPTIDGMFDTIQNAFDHHSARVAVTYDPALGYPVSIALDGAINVADDETSYTLSNFHVR